MLLKLLCWYYLKIVLEICQSILMISQNKYYIRAKNPDKN